MIHDEIIWVEKYRPKTIEDTILPKQLKDMFSVFAQTKNIPNLLLSGPPGIGKTTVARALLDEIGCDYIVINGSLKGNIDTLRNDIMAFASTVSFSGGRKFVILDEADYLQANSTQPALRNFMEEFSSNCGFILTCNFKNRIIEPLQSRCSTIDFNIPKAERSDMIIAMFKRVSEILKMEKITFSNEAVLEVIRKFFPDFRRVLNEIQRYSATGAIDSGILVNLTDTAIKTLVGYLKESDFSSMRKWVAENSDIESHVLFRRLYDTASTFCKPKGIAQLVLILDEYQYKDAFVIDKEINIVACCTRIMVDVEFDKK